MSDYESSDGANGNKFFRVDVPDYASGASPQRDAYLRIGSMNGFADPGTKPSGQLWSKFAKFLDQSPTEDPATHTRRRAVADARPPAHGQADTPENLLLYAGWRDHTDGNRITTTAGDKVEIIGGNYQLIVLGRSDDVGDGVLFDASGGHLVSGDIAPGMVTRVEYKAQKFGGTWKITEETDKGHVHEIFRGEFKEEFRGPRRTSIVGTVPASLTAAFAEAPDTDASGTESNDPALLDGTWASTITEYTGAPEKPVTTILSTTYANTIADATYATASITETVTAPSLVTNTYVRTIAETFGTRDEGCSVTSTHYGSKTETMNGDVDSTVTGHVKEAVYGSVVDTKHGGVAEFFLGGRFTATLAKTVELIAGMHTEVHAGSFREITLGYKWDLVVGWELEVDDYSIKVDKLTSKSIAAAIFLG